MSSAPSFCSSASRVVSPSVSPGVFYQIKNPSSGLNFLHEVQCYWTLWIWTLFFLIFKILFTFYQRDTNLDVGFTSRNGRLAWKIKLTKKRSINSCYSNRQYKITSLTWFGTEILSLCGLFSQLTENRFFLLDHLISLSPLVVFYDLYRFWKRLTPVFTPHSWFTIATP